MKNYYTIFIYSICICLFMSACIESKPTNKAKLLNQVHGSTNDQGTIIICSKMDIPVLISRTPSLYNLLESPLVTTTSTDTFRLKVHGKELFTISHNKMFTDSLFISPGDTIFIRFSDNYIITEKLINGENYSQQIQNKTRSSEVDSLTSLFYNFDYNNPMELSNDYEKIQLFQLKPNRDIKNNLEDFKKLVRLRVGLFHNYAKRSQNATDIDIDLERSHLFYDLNNLYSLSKNSDSLFISTKDEFINSDTQYYPLGDLYLHHAIYNVYFKHLQNKSRSIMHYDQFKIFDSLPKYFDSTLVKYGRMICLKEIAEQGESLEATTNHFEMFNNLYNDSIFRKYFESTYLTDLKQRYSSKNEVNLLDNFNEVSDLSDILLNLKGRVIFVDFWASWCAPCRSAMPASLNLRLEYKDSDVNFLFISIDENRKAWDNASMVEGFENYEYNYLLLNKDESALIKNLKINTIPRYLIYDREGKLVHQNAPGPEGPEIRKLLDKYLLE